MAEERDLVPTRAPETAEADDTGATKQELQRRMEEAREQISQTVTEIKETVVNQYQQVRSSINETLDWREQFRRRPVPFTVGAFGAGLVAGYALMGAIKSDSEDDYVEDDEAAFGRIEEGFDRMAGRKSPAAAAPFAASDLSRPALPERGATSAGSGMAGAASTDVGPDTRPSYGGHEPPRAAQAVSGASGAGSFGVERVELAEPKGPGLFERFRETKAYDRLQNELTTIGERVVEELSRTAQTVVVPALLGKLKDLIGIDLGTQRQVSQRTRLESQAAEEQRRAAEATEGRGEGGDRQAGQTQGATSAAGTANFATSGGRGA